MSQKISFNAVIESAGGGGAYVSVPYDVEKIYGQKRVKIKATIDGEPYRGTLVRMGMPHHVLIVLKEIREKIGKSFGDEVTVVLEEDMEVRRVELPGDLKVALEAEPNALAFFNKLSFTHQKEYVQWIEQAKRETTRRARIQRTVEMLLQSKSEH